MGLSSHLSGFSFHFPLLFPTLSFHESDPSSASAFALFHAPGLCIYVLIADSPSNISPFSLFEWLRSRKILPEEVFTSLPGNSLPSLFFPTFRAKFNWTADREIASRDIAIFFIFFKQCTVGRNQLYISNIDLKALI